MSMRHWVTLKKDNKKVKEFQILGNNDYFDEEFYSNMGLQLSEDCDFEETEIKLSKLLVEWYQWLNRHPEKKGVGREIVKDENYSKKIYLEYRVGDYYQLQPYRFMRLLADYLDDIQYEIKDGYHLTFEKK